MARFRRRSVGKESESEEDVEDLSLRDIADPKDRGLRQPDRGKVTDRWVPRPFFPNRRWSARNRPEFPRAGWASGF